MQEGYDASQLGLWEEAVRLWEAALTEHRSQSDKEQALYSLCYLSYGYLNLSQHERSLERLEECAELAVSLNDSAQQAQVLTMLSGLAFSMKDEQFIEQFERLLELARSFNSAKSEIDLFIRLGDAYNDLDLRDRAISTYQKSLEIARLTNDTTNQSRALIRIGNFYHDRQELDVALDFQQQALAIASSSRNANFQASALVNIANIRRETGQYQSAIDALQQALTIRQNELENDSHEEGIIYSNLGNLYKDLGHYDIAIQYQRDSLAIAEQTGDKQRQAIVLNSIGATYSDRGDSKEQDYGQAVAHFTQSLKLAQDTGDRRAQAETLNNLGSVYHRQLQYEIAKDYYEQSLEVAREIQNRRLIANALTDIGFASEGLQDYPTALSYYDRGIVQLKEIKANRALARAFNNRAHTLLVWSKQEKANGDITSATAKLKQAEANLEEAAGILQELWNRIDSDLDRVSLFDTQQMSYNLIQQVLIARSPTENAAKALQSSEEGRGRAFARVLADKFGYELDPPTPEKIREIARSRQVTLVEYAIMPRDDVIHQGKHVGKAGQVYIWVVQPTGDIHFQSVDLASQEIDLESLVQGSRESIGARNRGLEIISTSQKAKNEQQLKDLHKILIDPIEQWLPTSPEQKVIFIPHRELFLVPFAALQDSSGSYLVERHTPVTAPSIQLLDLTWKQRAALKESSSLERDNVLIVGNPKMPKYWNGEGFSQLSGLANAQLEANTIGRLFKADPLVGAEATEREVVARMSEVALIHLATHGLLEYRNENPMEPQEFPGAIALTATNHSSVKSYKDVNQRTNDPEDGLLTASEISELTLQAQLVVLSACDTGRGDLSGDGVLGLARSLITAGSPSVLVSLWSVPDAPTSELMQQFYRHWQTGKLDKAQALRQAMLDTKKTHPSPNDWAAFSLIGEFD